MHVSASRVCVQYLADVQEHLGETITEASRDMKVPSSEFDGKVVYGEKRKGSGIQVTTCFMYIARKLLFHHPNVMHLCLCIW